MTPLLPSDARERRFLVVDDSEDIRDLLCSFVGRSGHATRPAEDGQAAVEILQRESFDVMLLDLNMPRMGGVEVLRWLKAHPDVVPGLRVVVVTACSVQDLAHLADLGVTAVLEKPFRLRQLGDVIAEALHELDESALAS